jgi:hypothetical protein
MGDCKQGISFARTLMAFGNGLEGFACWPSAVSARRTTYSDHARARHRCVTLSGNPLRLQLKRVRPFCANQHAHPVP